jgi:hypothetical protein
MGLAGWLVLGALDKSMALVSVLETSQFRQIALRWHQVTRLCATVSKLQALFMKRMDAHYTCHGCNLASLLTRGHSPNAP